MADDHDGMCCGRQPADKVEQAVRRRLIHSSLEGGGWPDAEFRFGEPPGLAGAEGRGAQDVIGNAACLAEPASGSRGVAETTAAERPVVIWNVGPCRLGMPEEH